MKGVAGSCYSTRSQYSDGGVTTILKLVRRVSNTHNSATRRSLCLIGSTPGSVFPGEAKHRVFFSKTVTSGVVAHLDGMFFSPVSSPSLGRSCRHVQRAWRVSVVSVCVTVADVLLC